MKKSLLILIATIFLAGGMHALNKSAFAQETDPEKEITSITDLKRYKVSYIQGTVMRIPDEDEFILKDESGEILVYSGWKNTYVVDENEQVTVKGKLDPGRVDEFYASEIIREDGTILTLIPDE